uniref:Uncharacterized protein n=1 Tax=Tanacetum cinerariifolium TaxID=118510 RepID=A0A6L2LB61_TANCI|nr:hypothetical protein [Tanacetum cinerariifolium]
MGWSGRVCRNCSGVLRYTVVSYGRGWVYGEKCGWGVVRVSGFGRAVEAACVLEVDAIGALDLMETLKVEVEAVEALDLVKVEAVRALDLMEAPGALDLVKVVGALDLMEVEWELMCYGSLLKHPYLNTT